MFDNARNQVARRSRQVRTLVHEEGIAGLTEAARRTAVRRLGEGQAELLVRPRDVLAGEDAPWRSAPPVRLEPGEPLTVNWVTTAPVPGSGGHTTTFRMIRHLQARGHRCRVFFYDIYGADHGYYADIARRSFGFDGEIANVDDGMPDASAVVATSWPTVYAAGAAPCACKRFYLVQDYEPYFYPVGSNSTLAENTYRMGFHGITAGSWLAQKLANDFGMAADHFDFGSDTDRYRLDPAATRDGIVFYARPATARRGTEIGLMALELFAQDHPGLTIHLYGQRVARLDFKAVQHGTVRPEVLNTIYNSCYAGLSLSLTNVSLVPHEMLGAGCIPVVNDAPQNRLVLANDHIHYAPPSPHALAAALATVVATPDFVEVAKAASHSVSGKSWEQAGAQLETVLLRELS
jgi:hypothetical protein